MERERRNQPLTDKQEAFCRHYLATGGSQRRAYERSGYRTHGLHVRLDSSRLLKNPAVKKRILELQDEIKLAEGIDTRWWIGENVRLYQLCVTEKRYTDAARVLEMIGKYLGVTIERTEQKVTYTAADRDQLDSELRKFAAIAGYDVVGHGSGTA